MNTLNLGNLPNQVMVLTQAVIAKIEAVIPAFQRNKTGIQVALVAAAVEWVLIEISPPLAGFTAAFWLSTGVPIGIVYYLDKKDLL